MSILPSLEVLSLVSTLMCIRDAFYRTDQTFAAELREAPSGDSHINRYLKFLALFCRQLVCTWCNFNSYSSNDVVLEEST
ncbi:hypothetical protein BDV40DRAFT_30759 [Aspergillus tamarii]|uniref:Uncharacterized protein n=1 Tax=Aspergillus tamarii TaxID=41984 RepID=A0A5N6V5G9_ASPTM|nr:hypothetical protein BDV40DRAFT_30759 [Aspergillus tamarii]